MKSIVFFKTTMRLGLDIRSVSIYVWIRPIGKKFFSAGRLNGSAWMRLGRVEIFKHANRPIRQNLTEEYQAYQQDAWSRDMCAMSFDDWRDENGK